MARRGILREKESRVLARVLLAALILEAGYGARFALENPEEVLAAAGIRVERSGEAVEVYREEEGGTAWGLRFQDGGVEVYRRDSRRP